MVCVWLVKKKKKSKTFAFEWSRMTNWVLNYTLLYHKTSLIGIFIVVISISQLGFLASFMEVEDKLLISVQNTLGEHKKKDFVKKFGVKIILSTFN